MHTYKSQVNTVITNTYKGECVRGRRLADGACVVCVRVSM